MHRRQRTRSRLLEECGPPPDFWDGDEGGRGRGGGGGGGGGSGDGESGEEGQQRFTRSLAAAEFAFGFLLVGVATLFGVFVAAFLMLRGQSEVWPPPGAPVPPAGMWASTLLLLFSSVALFASGHARRKRDVAAMRRGLLLATLLGLAFLGSQAWLWNELLRSGYTTGSDAYGALFYSLTGLHGVHALGGVLVLAHLFWRTRRRALSSEMRLRARLGSLYWHFMGAIWAVLFVMLYLLDS